MNGVRLKHDPNPVYLGVTLDRSLTYKAHLTKTAAKVKTRNNLLGRLAGASWGSNAQTLRTSALALCYSTAEYCAPVWARSAHTRLVDVQLNCSMRVISGTIKSTPVEWLPVLSNIAPPHIRRDAHTARLLARINGLTKLPIAAVLSNPPTKRLPSRHPVWEVSPDANFSTDDRRREEWSAAQVQNSHLVADPTHRLPGFNLPRNQWSLLNRFRTGHGICGASRFRWGMRDNPFCTCGHEQTMSHIVDDCVLTRFEGGLVALNEAKDSVRLWLDALCIR